MSARLDDLTRSWLLHQARKSITAHLDGTERPSATDAPAAARQQRGCFVSIHTRAGMLRGCIGLFEGPDPLWQNVQNMAIAAATDDPRFAPMTRSELTDAVFEISALTPREPARPQEVEVGKHGVWVTRGHQRGVLLPQVAIQHGWDRETFLERTCVKAGLPPEAWRDGSVEIHVFTAEVFSEDKP